MRRIIPLMVLILLSLASFSINANAQTIGVSGAFNTSSVIRGEIARGSVILNIPVELHINSSKPKSEFLQPTTIRLSAAKLTNFKIFYPRGKERKFGFSENTLNVYDHKTMIRFSVFVPKNFRSKTIRVKAVVNYQACTDEVCYQPQKKEIYLQAKIK